MSIVEHIDNLESHISSLIDEYRDPDKFSDREEIILDLKNLKKLVKELMEDVY